MAVTTTHIRPHTDSRLDFCAACVNVIGCEVRGGRWAHVRESSAVSSEFGFDDSQIRRRTIVDESYCRLNPPSQSGLL